MAEVLRPSQPAIGWKLLSNSRKWHFFDANGRSLCGGWMTLGRQGEFGNDDSPDNCAKCCKRLLSSDGANNAR